jgi:His/Glu/Gln/Arg/opine family amino acid ABC transporter permease subunit
VFDRPVHILASFEWSFFWDLRGPFWDGFKYTIKAGLLGIVLAYVIGLVLGAVRAHRVPVLNQLAVTYVEIIRNTPILVQIFFLYYGLPVLGIHLEAFTVA